MLNKDYPSSRMGEGILANPLAVACCYATTVIERIPSVCDILLFGSVCKNKCHEWSDIDIAVIGLSENELEITLSLYDIVLSESLFRVHPVYVTIKEFNRVPPDGFIDEIKKGILLVSSNHTQDLKK